LNVVNFAHGAMFMMGAVFTWMAFTFLGIGYWPMLIIFSILVAVVGVCIEKFLLKYLYRLATIFMVCC
jgi:branched-chain amino acid transport system permease protein